MPVPSPTTLMSEITLIELILSVQRFHICELAD